MSDKADKFRMSRRSFLALSAALAACRPGAEPLRFSGPTMGTTYNVIAIASGLDINREDLGRAIDTTLAEVNTRMSNWDPASEISRVNAHTGSDPIRLSPELAHVMAGADSVHRASDGVFDVTVGPLIDLWGFGAAATPPHRPDDAAIAAALARGGQGDALSLKGNLLRKMVPGTEIYLSAIAKGYGVDRVAQTMRRFGLTDFMVEIGGDLYTAGRNAEGAPWQIGIETPTAGERGLQQVIGVSDLGMATSGDYRNFFEADGVRYSHIIDPTTGHPITHDTVSTTVLTGDAMMADAWATAMLVLGRARGLKIAETQDLAVLFIDRDGDSQFTTAASSRFAALKALTG